MDLSFTEPDQCILLQVEKPDCENRRETIVIENDYSDTDSFNDQNENKDMGFLPHGTFSPTF